MKRKFLKSILVVIVVTAVSFVCRASQSSRELLPDGFVINDADGKVTGPDSQGIYKFVFNTDISDGKIIIRAGTPIELLETAALMKMLDNYRPGENYGFLLSARVTAYGGKNYLFPVYFIPYKNIGEDEKSKTQQSLLQVNDPNNPLRIPETVLEKLTSGKEILPVQVRPGLELKEDFILADRTGYIEKQNNGRFAFVFDALGRNLDKSKIILIPCQALEKIQSEFKDEPVRLKVSGIITKYKGNLFLLLQKTSRVYSNGNFPG